MARFDTLIRLLGLPALMTGCGGGPAVAPAEQAPAARPTAADGAPDRCAMTPAPGDRFLAEWVSPEGAAALAALLDRRKPAPPGLAGVLRAFYAEHGDDYDLLMLVTPDAGASRAMGRFIRVGPVNRPRLGLVGRADAELHPIAPRLEGVVLLALPEGEGHRSGPTLHESLHRYGQFLPREAGFPRNGHWGYTGVHGQLGGFDPASLRCVEPPDARPPDCAAGPDGRFAVSVDRFAGFANGGDRVPYAPLELYLMGLIAADEVPDPIPVLRGPEPQPAADDGRLAFTVDGVGAIRMADVLAATGGPRPPATEAERNPRAAFFLVSAAPPTDDIRGAAEAWARGLAGAQPGWPTHSYCSATGGRARMDTRITPRAP